MNIEYETEAQIKMQGEGIIKQAYLKNMFSQIAYTASSPHMQKIKLLRNVNITRLINYFYFFRLIFLYYKIKQGKNKRKILPHVNNWTNVKNGSFSINRIRNITAIFQEIMFESFAKMISIKLNDVQGGKNTFREIKIQD